MLSAFFASFGQLAWSDAVTILTLVLLEGLLSADNALVLAVLVKDLPAHDQKLALRVGIAFAYLFRFFAILFATTLLQYEWVKFGAAAYLVYIAGKGLLTDGDPTTNDAGPFARLGKRLGVSAFVATIIAVELTDIAFSIDSITAAIAFSNKMAVVFIGGCLGILAMRFVAGWFIDLIEHYPILEKTAFVLVGIIGVKLGLTGFGIEIPDAISFTAIFGIFFGALGIQKWFPNSRIGRIGRDETAELKEEFGTIREENH